MKVAVVGAGIAGLVAARELDGEAEVHLFEAAWRPGGHAWTVEVEDPAAAAGWLGIDIGFIVYNERNYPLFSRLLAELGVATAPTSMGFAVSRPSDGFEYSGQRPAALLARRRNLADPRFWAICSGQVRFARAGARLLGQGAAAGDLDLDGFCRRARLPASFVELYLLPMAGAIWSMDPEEARRFPAATLLAFFRNHGLLSLVDRPDWRTVVGGSARYVEALLAGFAGRRHFGTPVRRIERRPDGVEIAAGGVRARFDAVVVALHADRALAVLADPTAEEREVLGAIRYRDNEVVLHRDTGVLPRRRSAWASWNVRLDGAGGIGVSYLMNELQPLATTTPWCVTLNRGDLVDPALVAHRATLAHPQLDAAAVAAQGRWGEISGRQHTHYCGAGWRHGFHEDGAWSGLRAAEAVRRVIAARAAGAARAA